MRCKFCRGLTVESLIKLAGSEFQAQEFPRRTWYQHQPSISALDESAQNGCDLCQLLVQALDSVTSNRHWDDELNGYDRSMDTTVLALARSLVDNYDTAIRICINTQHVVWQSPLSDVRMFDLLMVLVGPPQNDSFEMSNREVDDFDIVNPYMLPARLLLMTPKGKPTCCGRYRIGRVEVDPDLGSQQSFDIAKHWIHLCQSEHGAKCDAQPDSDPLLPTRVIDVGSREAGTDNKQKLFLSQGAKGKYLALSHCWGGRIETVLETKNINEFCVELPCDRLPRNFQDAIKITRGLGVRYLWIDSLCIMQDSRDDWAVESGKMAAVYENALVTIAALSSPRSSYGIFPQRSTPSSAKLSSKVQIFASNDNAEATLQAYYPTEDEDLRNLFNFAPLTSRGWCLQESVLSRRVLYYGRDQIYWECGRGFQAANEVPGPEFFPTLGSGLGTLHEILRNDGATSLLPFQGEGLQKLLWNYYSLVNAYSKRSLTYNSDKLPALSGLAQRLHPLVGGEYVAGLWTTDLKQGLLWSALVDKSSTLEHVKPYRAPSWSWTAVNGPLFIHRVYSGSDLMKDRPAHPDDIQILEVHAEPKDRRAPYGEVAAGHILARGMTIQLRRIQGKELRDSDPVGSVTFDEPNMAGGRTNTLAYMCNRGSSESDPAIYVGPAQPASELERAWKKYLGDSEERDYLVLWVRKRLEWVDRDEGLTGPKVNSLILEKVQTKGIGDNVYRRVGYFETYPSKDEAIGSWRMRELKII